MVFPSVPLFLDPPTTTTWNQQQQQQVQLQQQQPLVITNDPLQQPQPQPQPQPPQPQHRSDVSGNMGPPRPNSTAERARLAKIPQPEQALKCPRCDSTNTKFCYFNNYSLSQPRHFCKTCRRYWTRGGALRNVPVGGGCRRNKRSSSKSSASGASSSSSAASKAATASSSSAASAGPTSLPALPFGIQPLHPMMDYGGSLVPNLGLGFSGMQGMDSSSAANNSMGLEQWRVNQIQQQFPFLGGMESQLQPAAATQGMYSFDGQPTGSELITQMASVKMEDGNNTRGLNLARQYLGGVGGGGNSRTNNELQFWGGGGGGDGGEGSSGGGGGGWMTNLSGFNSSSTGSLL